MSLTTTPAIARNRRFQSAPVLLALFIPLLTVLLHPGPLPAAGWIQINHDGFGDSGSFAIDALIVFEGQVYATVQNYGKGAQIWRIGVGDTNPDNWVRVEPLLFRENLSARAMAVFKGNLYVGTDSGEIWGYVDMGGYRDWMVVDPPGWPHDTRRSVSSMSVGGDWLYVARENPLVVCRTADLVHWRVPVVNAFANTLNNYGGKLASTRTRLYVATYYAQPAVPVDGCEVRDGMVAKRPWQLINTPGFGDSWNSGQWAAIFAGALYVGTVSHRGGQIWRYASGAWENVSPCTPVIDPPRSCMPRVQSMTHTPYVLYAGFGGGGSNTGYPGVGILKTVDGRTWTWATDQANNAFGDAGNFSVNALTWAPAGLPTQNRHYLYAGTANDATGAEVWLRRPGRAPFESGDESPE